MRLSDFDYDLPAPSIAQHPPAERDSSRMLLLERTSGSSEDCQFSELPDLLRGDELIVVNNTKVIPARLFGRRQTPPEQKGATQRLVPVPADPQLLPARIEVMLVRKLPGGVWEALVRPGRKVRVGERIRFEDSTLEAEILGRGELGLRQLRFLGPADALAEIERIGHVPLPPYIRRSSDSSDVERYQTMFASQPGAVAAPTAGLHFTPAVMQRLRVRGVEICEITLEVGLGTFQPIHSEDLDQHQIHAETYEIPEQTAAAVMRARRDKRPILAIGTTVVRALEDAAQKAASAGEASGEIAPGVAEANIFIRPGHRFALVDRLLTNFHLPRSTLLVLVAAFAGREETLGAYRHAVASGYRFYSYGDCMLIK